MIYLCREITKVDGRRWWLSGVRLEPGCERMFMVTPNDLSRRKVHPLPETEGRADEPALQHSGLWRASAREVQGRTVRTVDDVNAAR